MSTTTTYHLRPVSAMTRSASPTASTSTESDRSPPPLNAHHPPSKAMLPPASSAFSPIQTSARPRRPISPTSIRDVELPLDNERGFATRGKYPAPPTGHELMALFPPAPPVMRLGSTSGFFEREERKFFAQAGKEIVRLRLEVDALSPSGGGGGGGGIPPPPPGLVASPPHPHHQHARAHSHPHSHHSPHPHPGPPPPHHGAAPPPAVHPGLAPPPPPPHTTSPRSHLSSNGGAFSVPSPPVGSPMGPPPPPTGPAHPGYPVNRQPMPELDRAPGGGSEAMVVEEDDDEAWRRPTPHNARRRAGKHTRRVIVK